MRWRQVVLLWVVLAALAADYLLVERRRPPAPEGPAPRPRFLPIDARALREVRLERGGRTVVTRRTPEGWEVVEPRGAVIPPGLLAAFANALAAAEEIARVAGAEADRHAFGLEAGAARVEILADTGAPVVVTLGEINPTGTAVYAQRGGASDVVLIGRQVRYYEDLIFQALPAGRAPAESAGAPIGG